MGDAYCGAAARLGPDGCAFRACDPGERLDALTGACMARAALEPPAAPCADGGLSVLAQRHVVCLPGGASPLRDALCPRGTHSEVGAAATTCARPPVCPPGSLPEGAACRPIVTVGGHDALPRVDVGAWASLVLGVDGGRGSADLCRPVWLRPDLFAGAGSDTGGAIYLQVHLSVPDQDLSRAVVETEVEVQEGGGGARRTVSGEAEALASTSAATLVEPLRALGGESSAAVVDLRVRCSP